MGEGGRTPHPAFGHLLPLLRKGRMLPRWHPGVQETELRPLRTLRLCALALKVRPGLTPRRKFARTQRAEGTGRASCTAGSQAVPVTMWRNRSRSRPATRPASCMTSKSKPTPRASNSFPMHDLPICYSGGHRASLPFQLIVRTMRPLGRRDESRKNAKQ